MINLDVFSDCFPFGYNLTDLAKDSFSILGLITINNFYEGDLYPTFENTITQMSDLMILNLPCKCSFFIDPGIIGSYRNFLLV